MNYCSVWLDSFSISSSSHFAYQQQPFTILDLDSAEERGGTSLSNTGEAQLALHLFKSLRRGTDGHSVSSRVAVVRITDILCTYLLTIYFSFLKNCQLVVTSRLLHMPNKLHFYAEHFRVVSVLIMNALWRLVASMHFRGEKRASSSCHVFVLLVVAKGSDF